MANMRLTGFKEADLVLRSDQNVKLKDTSKEKPKDIPIPPPAIEETVVISPSAKALLKKFISEFNTGKEMDTWEAMDIANEETAWLKIPKFDNISIHIKRTKMVRKYRYEVNIIYKDSVTVRCPIDSIEIIDGKYHIKGDKTEIEI